MCKEWREQERAKGKEEKEKEERVSSEKGGRSEKATYQVKCPFWTEVRHVVDVQKVVFSVEQRVEDQWRGRDGEKRVVC